MAGKAKPKKHTAKELKQKQDAALTNKGGGKAGLADRKGGAAGHAKFKCPICGMAAPSIKSGELHWDSKHPKMPFKTGRVVGFTRHSRRDDERRGGERRGEREDGARTEENRGWEETAGGD